MTLPGSAAAATPSPQHQFAVDVVKRLRAHGFVALWAGGCVRDALLGLTPKDYDVATDARPEQVIELFGKRRTVPVGASFGVVMVLGPDHDAGQIEVATFRTDGDYFDGRRPASVQFCSPEQDAQRRDFTINGMFIDPLSGEVIDFVNGRRDLTARLVQAIGDPRQRFTEDKLRMLRAIRFAATYDFRIEEDTFTAIQHLRQQVTQVSVERIAQELRRMLSHSSREIAVAMMHDAGLLSVIFPEVVPDDPERTPQLQECLQILQQLQQPAFEPSLAALLAKQYRASGRKAADRIQAVRSECVRLRLSNEETGSICWLVDQLYLRDRIPEPPLHVIKPLLVDHRRDLLLDLLQARQQAGIDETDFVGQLHQYLNTIPAAELDPPPLVTGADLKALDVAAGPVFRELLTAIRHEQLDQQLNDRTSALQRLRELVTARKPPTS